MNRLILIFASTLLLLACTKENDIVNASEAENISLNLSINTLAANDPMSVNQDQTFGSLAVYLYNADATFTLDKFALLSSFSPTTTKNLPFQVKVGSKILYLIANYTGKTFKQTNGSALTFSAATTKQQLDDLITESSRGFSPDSLLMVGQQAMTLTDADNGHVINVALRRLQARVDVHVFKGPNFGSNPVTLKSVTLNHQTLNSEVKFDYTATAPGMLTAPSFNSQTISTTPVLSPYVVGTVFQPTDAQAIFYSYQNLVTVLSPLQVTVPYLQITVLANGVEYTYNGYITDGNQTTNKYSLLQNCVYQITAIVDVDSKITLNVNILPWNQENIAYERPITANDFSFGAWGTSWGGLNGKTMNTNVGGLEDAVFQFELDAPIGAAWTATLTNGLDFAFTSSTAGTTTTTVSKGFTNIGNPSLIAVRASKRWTGSARDTEFYITVEGNEIPINPIVGSQRKYDGTDTRIKITQVASYN